MKNCTLCPRKCKATRSKTVGFCKANDEIIVSKVMLHKYEEPLLTSKDELGSGAIFFSGCNLRCVYCQNYEISHTIKGEVVAPKELANIFKDLENQGAGNIDLVTPTHFTDKIIEALKIYKPKVPVIWNTSGYEEAHTIKKLKKYVDIYLTDFKYASEELAERYSSAKNYPSKALSAIKQMRKNQPKDVIVDGKLVKGLIVRHMVLPKNVEDSKNVLGIINKELSNNTIVSLMSQYTPLNRPIEFSELNNRISPLEYKVAINHALKLGFKNAFTQELSSATSFYTPKF